MRTVKHILKTGAYANKYANSCITKPEFVAAKDEMNRIRSKIGLPLEGTYFAVHTDANVLKELENEKDKEPTYLFLGMSWNLKRDDMKPLARFNLGKKLEGTSANQDLMEMSPSDIESQSFAWGLTQRNIQKQNSQKQQSRWMCQLPRNTQISKKQW